jgi:transcriptional regulator with XRE-family HTH domain
MSEIVASGSIDDEGISAPLGGTLARFRRAMGLTGQELASRAGMSQPKISKIETGAVRPTPRDVERIGRALEIPAETVRRMAEQAEGLHNRMTDWRIQYGGLAGVQREVERIERASTVFRVFQPAIFGGLLQTTEYARAVLSNVQRSKSQGNGGEPGETVPEAVSARIQRQEVLANKQKRFTFLMPETVLQHLVCRASDMAAQIQRIREISRQPNVSVKIIEATVHLAYPPYHSFSLWDDRMVLIDLFNTVLTSRGRSDVRLYSRVFGTLESQATDKIEPILDRYFEHYLDLARPNRRQP